MNDEVKFSKVRFTTRPESVPYFYRLSYRVAITCLILRIACRKNSSCSLTKLHLIISTMFSENESEKLLENIRHNNLADITLRFDPTVNTTVEFLLADEIIKLTNTNQFILTEIGNDFVDSILTYSELLIKEKTFLIKLGSKLTESKIKQISNQII